MEFFKHRFDDATNYLHHRPPYLVVDRIVSIEETAIQTEKVVKGDEFYLQGHFPGAPILPGAMMQELMTQSAGILIAANYNPMKEYNTEDPFFNEYALGVLVKVKTARYKSFARPGDKVSAHVNLLERVSNVFDFSARGTVEGQLIMKIEFQLANIKSSVLQGRGEQASTINR